MYLIWTHQSQLCMFGKTAPSEVPIVMQTPCPYRRPSTGPPPCYPLPPRYPPSYNKHVRYLYMDVPIVPLRPVATVRQAHVRHRVRGGSGGNHRSRGWVRCSKRRGGQGGGGRRGKKKRQQQGEGEKKEGPTRKMGVFEKKTWEVESVGGGVGGRQCAELGGHHA